MSRAIGALSFSPAFTRPGYGILSGFEVAIVGLWTEIGFASHRGRKPPNHRIQ
jgi:hypothetical protein